MKGGSRAPLQVTGAVVLIVVAAAVALAAAPTAAGGFTVLIAILLAWLLLRGSKVAWVVAVASGAADLVFSIAGEGPSWGMLIDVLVLIGLAMPSSVCYFWGRQSKNSRTAATLPSALGRIRAFAYRLLARAAGWKGSRNQAPRFRLLAWRLGVASLLLLGPVGLTYGLTQESPHDRALAIVASVVWMCWALATVACLVVVALALWERFTGRLPPSPNA